MKKRIILSPLEITANEILNIERPNDIFSDSERVFLINTIADCLYLNPESERFDRFVAFALSELSKKRDKKGGSNTK